MKQFRYLFALLLLIAAGACSKDTTTPPEKPTPNAGRETFLKASAIGIYQNGKQEYAFDKTTQQLYVNPSNFTFRILDDTGTKYTELRLNQMPTAENRAKASFENTVGLKLPDIEYVEMLKNEDRKLWIWCEEAQTGFIVPWIAE